MVTRKRTVGGFTTIGGESVLITSEGRIVGSAQPDSPQDQTLLPSPERRAAEEEKRETTEERRIRRGLQLQRAREKALSRAGGNREGAAQIREAQRTGAAPSPVSRTVEDVQANRAQFEQAAQQAGLLGGAPGLVPDIETLDQIPQPSDLAAPLVESIASGLIKLKDITGFTTGAIANPLLRKELLREEIRETQDTQLVQLGLGPLLYSLAKTATAVAGGIAISETVSKPLSILVDFNRKIDTLNGAIPDLRERIGKIPSSVRLSAYTAEEGLQRITEAEQALIDIERAIRISAKRSLTFKFSDKVLQIQERLNKAREEIAAARASVFIQQQQAAFPDAREEELIALLRELQSTRFSQAS